MAEIIQPEPRLVSLYGMYIIGVEARTTNRDEENGATAQIPALWQRFTEEKLLDAIPDPREPTVMLGAYTRYQSDDKGPYSVIVGAEACGLDRIPPNMVGITVLAQEYLIFTAAGEMPAAVIDGWKQVWKYFSGTTVLKRAYTTDFERYDSARPNEVEIHIAVR
ncbi:MAG: GyrI-like domain-containing protein [Thermoanaerobaculia bacterium]